MLLRSILCGGVWNGFLLEKARKEEVSCQSCGRKDGDGRLFWDCTFLPVVHVRELGEFAPFKLGTVVIGPGACFGMAGCLVLVLLGPTGHKVS